MSCLSQASVDPCPTTIADRFSPAMNAATSRYGVLCDVALIFVVLAAVSVTLAACYVAIPSLPLWIAALIVPLPLIVSAVTHIVLRNARRTVSAWVATVPFELQNLNSLLCGGGEKFDIVLASKMPSRKVVMEHFGNVHTDTIVLQISEENQTITARFGVLESKFNPYAEAYRRFDRCKQLCDKGLLALHCEYPIKYVRFT